MKRLMAMVMATAMVLSLVACGGGDKPAASAPAASKPAASAPATSAPADDGKLVLADGSKYPTEPINLYCPWAAGGSSDLMCRKISEMAKEYLGVNMNVTNVEGGNGSVALGEIANATKGDGYTISLYSAGNFTTMPYTQDVTYTMDDFKFIKGVSSEPLGVIVPGDSEWNCLQDVVDTYKATGEPILHGQSGSNGTNHMWSIIMFENMGVEESIVPYSGASGAIAALMGGEVPMIIVQPGQVLGSIESGDVKVIALYSTDELEAFPGVQTVEQQGFGEVFCETYKGLVVPADTDDAIVEWLEEGFTNMFASAEWEEFLTANAIFVQPLSGAMAKPESGITPFLMMALDPIISGGTPLTFALFLGLAATLLTQVMNNGAVGVAMMPIIYSYCQAANVSPELPLIMVVMGVHFAFLTPAASASAALLHGNEWSDSKAIWKTAPAVILMSYLVTAAITIIVGKAIF